MKICITTMGSRGDVQPYLALAIGLKNAGFEVVFIAPTNFQAWVEGYGVQFHGVDLDYAELMTSDVVRRWMDGRLSGLVDAWRGALEPVLDSVLEASAVAAEIGDAVLYDVKMIGGADAAEASGKPAICMSYVPMTTPDPGYPLPFFPVMQMTFAEDRGAWINRATHLAGRLLRCFYLPRVQAWRRDRLNLKNGPWFPPIGSIAGRPAPRLHFLSRHIVTPADRHDPDVQTLGFLYLDEAGDWEPSEALAAFLEAGPPPIYIGFGSMTAADPARTREVVLEGVRRAGVRALIGKGWGALDHSLRDENVFVIDYAPHQKLFPLTSATVHHGGAGTTGESLRAGKPTFVGAFSFDQPWWGARLKDLGVGPGARWLRSLTADGFADALRDLAGRAEYQRNANALAQKIAAENGVRDGVAAVTRLLAA